MSMHIPSAAARARKPGSRGAQADFDQSIAPFRVAGIRDNVAVYSNPVSKDPQADRGGRARPEFLIQTRAEFFPPEARKVLYLLMLQRLELRLRSGALVIAATACLGCCC